MNRVNLSGAQNLPGALNVDLYGLVKAKTKSNNRKIEIRNSTQYVIQASIQLEEVPLKMKGINYNIKIIGTCPKTPFPSTPCSQWLS